MLWDSSSKILRRRVPCIYRFLSAESKNVSRIVKQHSYRRFQSSFANLELYQSDDFRWILTQGVFVAIGVCRYPGPKQPQCVNSDGVLVLVRELVVQLVH